MSKYVSSLDICRFWVYFVSRRDCLRETDLAFSEKYNWQGCCTWYYHMTHLNCPDDSIEHQTANQGHGFDPRLRQSCCLRQKYPLPHWPVTCKGSVSSALWHPGTYDHYYWNQTKAKQTNGTGLFNHPPYFACTEFNNEQNCWAWNVHLSYANIVSCKKIYKSLNFKAKH